MTGRRWSVNDAFGRLWRLWIPRFDDTGGLPRDQARGAIRSLLWASSNTPSDRYATMLAIHAELAGTPGPAPTMMVASLGMRRSMWERVSEGLERAASTGRLRIEPVARAQSSGSHEPGSRALAGDRQAVVPETTSWFELEVVDEVGEPIPGLDVAFDVGPERRVVSTNSIGIARFDEASSGFLPAAVASAAQLREKLAPRWTKPRTAKLPTGPDVHVAEVDAATGSLSLESERRVTLVVTPLFRCNELSGVHFAFARSFLLESALDTLSVMAAAVMEDEDRRAMIFGHTDISGSEALNKELSERRARVVLTVLTHDTDAWEELWTGSADGQHFKEQWGLKEAQHLLNALGVAADDGQALVEDGIDGPATGSAMRRFQRGDYEGARKGRTALPVTGKADRATRKEFLLSFADEVSHDPIPKDRFASIGGSAFMGCGEYNPLSDHARDAASRRTVLFVFDRAAEPQNLPCKLRSLGPCKGAGGVDNPLPDPLPDDKPYRCSIYREVAKTCPCVKGEELMHLAVQLHDHKFDPAPDIHYEALLGGNERVFGTTDSDGIMHAAVRKADIALRVTYQPLSEPSPVTINALILLPDQDETDRAFVQKIRNLGFGAQGDSDAFAIRKFQDAHKDLKRTGRLDDETKQAVRDLDDAELRPAFDEEPQRG